MSETDETAEGPTIITVASGKGGAGKSLLVSNLGIFLATLGNRVIAVDASFGSASLHHFVGVPHSRRRLASALDGGSLEMVMEGTAVPGLEMIAAQQDPLHAANPRPGQVTHLVSQLRSIDADYVIVDTESGTRDSTLELFLAADLALVLVALEPTAMELGYRFLRAAFARRLQMAAGGLPIDLSTGDGGVPSPTDLFARAVDTNPDVAELIEAEMRSFSPFLVLNNVRSKADMELGLAMTAAARRRLGLKIGYLGHLDYDDAVSFALRRKRPLLIEHPEARLSKCIEKVTRRLITADDGLHPRDPRVRESYYERLEVEPSATEEEIRRANRRVREHYSPDSVIVAGLYSPAELDRLIVELDEAYDCVMDPTRRKAYDRELFPDGVPSRVVTLRPSLLAAAPPLEERPPMPELSATTQFSGSILRQVREALGLDLREIAEHTKIGMAYLDAIETETFGKLPAPVYIRGFLTEYAKKLGLNTGRVADSYLSRYHELVPDREE